MAAVLMMVGRGQESPKIVQQLLDIHQHPCKPQYNMANEVQDPPHLVPRLNPSCYLACLLHLHLCYPAQVMPVVSAALPLIIHQASKNHQTSHAQSLLDPHSSGSLTFTSQCSS